MSQSNSVINQLINALRCLPGVGPKSAQRMAFHLLERNRAGARNLAEKLSLAMDKVGHCSRCRNFSEVETCEICRSERRNRSLLCIVESPADVQALDQAGGYGGLYFVLMGRLSPLDGIGPQQIGLDKLAQRLDEGEVKELILATNATVEGEATAHFVAEMARQRNIKTTRIAQGIPLGGELEYIDGGTLAQALTGRRDY